MGVILLLWLSYYLIIGCQAPLYSIDTLSQSTHTISITNEAVDPNANVLNLDYVSNLNPIQYLSYALCCSSRCKCRLALAMKNSQATYSKLRTLPHLRTTSQDPVGTQWAIIHRSKWVQDCKPYIMLTFFDVDINLRGRFTSNPGDSFSIQFNVSLLVPEDILSSTVSLTWEA